MPWARKSKAYPSSNSGDWSAQEGDYVAKPSPRPYQRTYVSQTRSRHLVGNQITTEQWEEETRALVEAKKRTQRPHQVEGEVARPKPNTAEVQLDKSARGFDLLAEWRTGSPWQEYPGRAVNQAWSVDSGE